MILHDLISEHKTKAANSSCKKGSLPNIPRIILNARLIPLSDLKSKGLFLKRYPRDISFIWML